MANNNGSRQAEARAALIQSVQQHVPVAMRERKQWLVWRFIHKPGQDKPAKVPHYINGELRGWPHGQPPHPRGERAKPTAEQPQVDQGHELDRQHLATMDEAIATLQRGRFDGIGFAFLPGDGLIGIDVDRAIDPETGEVADHCSEIISRCASYTEVSPSGTGVHVIVSGETTTFKDNDVGVEVFCGRQFFTVTGRPFGELADVQPLSDDTLAWLRKMVKGDKQQALAAPAPGSAPVNLQSDQQAYASRYCLAALQTAVQRMRNAGSGKRNDTLNMEAFGLAQLVHTGGISEYVIRSALADAAAAVGLDNKEIQATMGSAIEKGLQKPRQLPPEKKRGGAGLQVVRPEPPPEGEPKRPPDQTSAQDGSPSPTPEQQAWAEKKKAKGKSRKPKAPTKDDEAQAEAERIQQQAFWERVDTMCRRFVLVEATDEAWDRLDQTLWKIPNMRIRFGRTIVGAWLSRVAENRAPTVKLVDLVFEPGRQVPDTQINMFGGLTLQPIPCDVTEVAPMLNLLYHLCMETASGYDVIALMHWVLCWQALPIQKLGTKMQTACVFHGAQGTGKNLYWDLWRDVFGVYGITVGQTEIEDKFNGWVSRKMAIIGDEVVSRQEMYHNKNRLKSVVTQEQKFAIRGMQRETRWETNYANVVFLSNESKPLALEERDRRHLVVYTPLEADPKLYEAVRDFKANGGLAKWLYFLQHYPIGEFHAHVKPPMTKAKADLIELNWKPSERFAHEWLTGLLDLPVRVCAAEQLYRAFRRWCDRQGEKWPPNQANFTKEVERWVRERVKRNESGQLGEPRLRYKVIAIVTGGAVQARKAVRCWVPRGCGPREGVSEGAWAGSSVDTFESDLNRYCRTPGLSEDSK